MQTTKLSLRKIVSYLNNRDEDGGFWLPNIQRPFVWSEELKDFAAARMKTSGLLISLCIGHAFRWGHYLHEKDAYGFRAELFSIRS